MNPAGFLFGPNATVNIGGMVTFTSADYLRLADNARFNAIPHTRPDMLLSAAPVAAFGFLGSNPGAITVQGSHLSVAEGTGISLVGGDIQITGGTLEAPSGQINLVSIAGRGDAGVSAAGIAVTAGTPMGKIVVSGGNQPSDLARFDASGDEGGAVVIRGGQLSLARTEITTDARTTNHTGAGIVVEATDSAILDGVIFATHTSGFPNPDTVGGAGPVSLTAPSVTASNVTIDTSAFNEGPGGDVAINIGSLTASTLQIFSFVHGNSPGPASGNVSIRATGNVTLQNGAISTAAFGARDAGQIAVQVATLTLTDGAAIHSGSQPGSSGGGGNIVINVRNLIMQTSFIVPQISTYTASVSHGGDISVAATGAVMISRGAIDARTDLGHAEGGSITLSTPRLTLDHFGQITTTTFGDTRAGDISVNVRSLNMLNGGRIGSSACCLSDHGSAGNVNIVASKSISMAGVSDVTIPFPTEISSTTSSAGNAGRVHIVTPTLHLNDQAVISASSQSAGHAGTIVIDAARNITTDHGAITATGQGQGGNVRLHAGKSVQIQNGSLISPTIRAWAMRAIS
jgi:large exoprotein involved in heme utilization and adhesion